MSAQLRTDKLEVIDMSELPDVIYMDGQRKDHERKLYYLGGCRGIEEVRFEDDELAKRLLVEEGFVQPPADGPFFAFRNKRIVYATREDESWEDRLSREEEERKTARMTIRRLEHQVLRAFLHEIGAARRRPQ